MLYRFLESRTSIVIIETLRDFGLPKYGNKKQRVARLLVHFLDNLESKGVNMNAPPSSHANDEFEHMIRNTTCLRFQKATMDQLDKESVQPPSVQQLHEEMDIATENVRISGVKARRKQINERNKWKYVRNQRDSHGGHSSRKQEPGTGDSPNGYRNARKGEHPNTAGNDRDGNYRMSLIQAVADLNNRMDYVEEMHFRQMQEFGNSLRDLSKRITDLEARSSKTNRH